jgi:hypothetical protein
LEEEMGKLRYMLAKNRNFLYERVGRMLPAVEK